MSIPLDNLYHWVEGLLPCPAVLYLFYPHGSRNISGLQPNRNHATFDSYLLAPAVFAHDQEPLSYKRYRDVNSELPEFERKRNAVGDVSSQYAQVLLPVFDCMNMSAVTFCYGTHQMFDQSIVIHSEKNSKDLEQYQQNGFVDVYYWSHAVIARDWYRFAQYDTRLTRKSTQHLFLIYCRDWSNTREYRLKFQELLAQNDLVRSSVTSLMHTNSDGVHFRDHEFSNPEFQVQHSLLESISENQYDSQASADYVPEDFATSLLSVVLETEFDGSRIHLTEKILRPIACGHPFMLVAGPGSLEYLRSYGFRTFAPWIDESYDLETNSVSRLKAVVASMKKIQQLKPVEQALLAGRINQIADYNRKHFFSEEFFSLIEQELKTNLENAVSRVWKTQGQNYLKALAILKQHGLHRADPNLNAYRGRIARLLRSIRQSCR
jgi:hypothetical protein